MIQCFLVLNLIVDEPLIELYVRLLQEKLGLKQLKALLMIFCHGSRKLMCFQHRHWLMRLPVCRVSSMESSEMSKMVLSKIPNKTEITSWNLQRTEESLVLRQKCQKGVFWKMTRSGRQNCGTCSKLQCVVTFQNSDSA